MSQVKTHRGSLHNPGTPRSQSSSSLASASTTTSSRPRRIHINLPKATSTAAAFLSPTTGTSTLSQERIQEDRVRYAELVAKNATSEVSIVRLFFFCLFFSFFIFLPTSLKSALPPIVCVCVCVCIYVFLSSFLTLFSCSLCNLLWLPIGSFQVSFEDAQRRNQT